MKRLAAALLLVASLAHAQGWGWTPTTPAIPVPPSAVAVRFGTALQAIVDSLPSTGGIIQLDPGRFYANASDSTLPLTLTKSVTIIGQSFSGTTMCSPILVEVGDCHLEGFGVRPAGAAYGVKLFRDDMAFPGGGGVPRCTLRNMFIGAVDTTARNAGQGPVIGLYLDGAILTTIDHCTFAFCTQSGVYLDASQRADGWSTNVNVFQNCTSNLNSHYGVETSANGAIEGFQWRAGNIENNTWGACNMQSMTSSGFYGTDFESNIFTIDNLITVATSFPFTLEDCSFSTSHITRAFNFFTCGQVNVLRCRFTTFNSYSAAGTFDDRCNNIYAWGNVFTTGGFFENRSENHSLEITTTPFQRDLGHFYGVMWGPSTSGALATVGSAWTPTALDGITQPTPTSSHLSGWLRRTTFTGIARAETGIKQTAAQDYQFWQGDSAGTGGWYFSATFRLDAWGGNSGRLFVGLVSSTATAPASVADSSGLTVGDAIGLYHDATDAGYLKLVATKAGVTTKAMPANGATPPVLDNGQGFRFEMYAPPNASVVYCRLYSLNNYGTLCFFATLTNLVTKTAFMAPQVEVGSAANTYSLGIANVTVQVAR